MTDERFPFKMYHESGAGCLVNSRSSDRAMEIVEIISGSVLVYIGTEQAEAEAGDFLFVPPGMVFRVETSSASATIQIRRGLSDAAAIMLATKE